LIAPFQSAEQKMCSPYGIDMKGIFLKMQKQEASASANGGGLGFPF
jgi:hypothetical protein